MFQLFHRTDEPSIVCAAPTGQTPPRFLDGGLGACPSCLFSDQNSSQLSSRVLSAALPCAVGRICMTGRCAGLVRFAAGRWDAAAEPEEDARP